MRLFALFNSHRSMIRFVVGIILGAWVLTIIGASAMNRYTYTVDVQAFPGYGAYSSEASPTGLMRWLMPESYLLAPTPVQGWQLLRLHMRIANTAQLLTIRTDTQPVAAITLNDTRFRHYTVLVRIAPQTPHITSLFLRSNTSELINQRYIALAIHELQLQPTTAWSLPTLHVGLFLLINIILTSIIAWLVSRSYSAVIGFQCGLAMVHGSILWTVQHAFGGVWVYTHILAPLPALTLVLGLWVGALAIMAIMRRYPVTSPTPHRYRADIDGIRAIAVLSVVVYHVFPSLIPGGFIGVDVFFVISGFLITQNILNQHLSQQFSLVDFYRRRIRRIIPALSLVLLVSTGLAWVVLYTPEFAKFGANVSASVGFYNNIYLYTTQEYFADLAIQTPLLHLWSLGIEEQFYIVWPLLIGFCVRNPRWQTALLAGFVALSLGINIVGINVDPNATFYLLPSRLWQLALGGILAHLHITHSPGNRWYALWAVIGMAGIVIGLASIHHQLAYPGWYAIVPTVATVLLIAAGPHTWVNRTILSHPVMVAIGLISYPLYLWHWPVLVFTTFIAEFVQTPLLGIAVIAVSIGLAAATYHFVERPLRFGRYQRIPASALLVVFLCIGGIGYAAQTGAVVALAKPTVTNLRESHQVSCQNWLATAQLDVPIAGNCYAHVPETPPHRQHIVIGDSHARAYTSGLIAQTPQDAVFRYASDGCLPLVNVERFDMPSDLAYGCTNPLKLTSVFTVIQQSVAQSTTPTVVYVVGRYGLLDDTRLNPHETLQVHYQRPGPYRVATIAQTDTVWSAGLHDTFAILSTLPHTQIVFIHQAPEFPFTPLNCLRTMPFFDTNTRCIVDRSRTQQHFARYHHLVNQVLRDFPNVISYDPADALCTQTQCTPLGPDNALLYYDHHHLNTSGGAVVARQLLEHISVSDNH